MRSELLESAKGHWKQNLGGDLASVDVPEWPDPSGEPTTIFFKSGINFTQQEKILKLSDEGKKAEAIVESLIQRALDVEGKRMFKSADRVILMREVDPEIIGRIVAEMGQNDEHDISEMEKN